MITDKVINSIVYGTTNNISDDILNGVKEHVMNTMNNLDRIRVMSTSKNDKKEIEYTDNNYYNISELMNSDSDAGTTNINGILNDIYEKNKKYYSILKDYDLMPTLIPQIFRVLSFLTDECISPDLQTNKNFSINIKTGEESSTLYSEIDSIRETMELDRLLRNVWDNRFKMGAEYYLVTDYRKTFDSFKKKIESGQILNESNGITKTEHEILDESCSKFLIHEKEINNENITKIFKNKKPENTKIDDLIDTLVENIVFNFDLSTIPETAQKLKTNTIAEKYIDPLDDFINESLGTTKDKYISILDYLSKKDYDDCSVYRLDPEKVFKLAPNGKTIGYFYIRESEKEKNNHVDFLSDTIREKIRRNRLLSSNKNHIKEEDRAEKKIAFRLAEKILNTFDPSIGISNVEDIDLFHDYIMHNELDRSGKKIVFYYPSEIIDMSRSDGSLLTNAVFFTKLASTLMLNNIITKVLRGRGRQIHTVNMGVSPSIQRYIENAVSSLSMPETRLGSITGSFKYLLNPLNSASDIIIPSEDGVDKYITTDLIEGQDVDMDMEIIKFLMNSIVMSFGLDSAVIDTTNGNVDFAKTLTMISKQIANKVLVEQKDLIDSWSKFVLKILSIKGSEELKTAIQNNQLDVKFFTPKSLLATMASEELDNAKRFAETLADTYPLFQMENTDINRMSFIYDVIKSEVNLNWSHYDTLVNNSFTKTEEKIKEDIRKEMENYATSIKQKDLSNGEESAEEGDDSSFDDDMDI